MAEENTHMKAYIAELEKSHCSLSTDLTMWQSRWRGTAASNVKLCKQLMSCGGRRAPAGTRTPPDLPRAPSRLPHLSSFADHVSPRCLDAADTICWSGLLVRCHAVSSKAQILKHGMKKVPGSAGMTEPMLLLNMKEATC